MAATSAEAAATGRDIVIERRVAAPRELVWRVWTDPVHLARWWGGEAFRTTVVALDLRVGGELSLELRDADGNVHPCRGTFVEVSAPERLVLRGVDADLHPCGAGLPPRSLTVVSFAEDGDGTRVRVHTALASAAAREAATRAGFDVGWKASLDVLADIARTVPR